MQNRRLGMTKYGNTREELYKELRNEPQVTCISTDAKHISILSYAGETDDENGRRYHYFYRIKATKAHNAHCIDHKAFDRADGYRATLSGKECRDIIGTDQTMEEYRGVILRCDDTFIVADPQGYSFNMLKKLTGVFYGPITDEFRNMFIATSLIDMENNIAVYYTKDDLSDGVLHPMGFARVRGADAMSTTDDENSLAWEAVEQSILSEFGKEAGCRMLEGDHTATKHGSIHIMIVSPAELEVMHLCQYQDETYKFMAIDPRICEMCFVVDKSFRQVTFDTIAADRLGLSRKDLETEGFMLLLERDNMNPVIVRSSSMVTKDMCRIAGQKETPGTGTNLFQNVMIARAIGQSGNLFHISAQEIAKGSNVTFSAGLKVTKRRCDSINFLASFAHIERAMAKKGFVLKLWRHDNADYTIDFVLVDVNGDPVQVRAGKYGSVTVGIELQFSYDTNTANKLCGVFYVDESTCYCGNVVSREDYGPSAVFVQKKTGSTDFTMLFNGFFYGSPDGDSTALTAPSSYRYLMMQAGFTGEKISVFERLASMQPSTATRETFSAINNERSANGPFQISRRIGKRQLRQAAGKVSLGKDWNRLDTVMLLAAVSNNNTAELFRKRLSMACIGELLA